MADNCAEKCLLYKYFWEIFWIIQLVGFIMVCSFLFADLVNDSSACPCTSDNTDKFVEVNGAEAEFVEVNGAEAAAIGTAFWTAGAFISSVRALVIDTKLDKPSLETPRDVITAKKMGYLVVVLFVCLMLSIIPNMDGYTAFAKIVTPLCLTLYFGVIAYWAIDFGLRKINHKTYSGDDYFMIPLGKYYPTEKNIKSFFTSSRTRERERQFNDLREQQSDAPKKSRAAPKPTRLPSASSRLREQLPKMPVQFFRTHTGTSTGECTTGEGQCGFTTMSWTPGQLQSRAEMQPGEPGWKNPESSDQTEGQPSRRQPGQRGWENPRGDTSQETEGQPSHKQPGQPGWVNPESSDQTEGRHSPQASMRPGECESNYPCEDQIEGH